MKIAVFPGQGSQFIGMGKDLFDKYEVVKKLFKEAEEISNIKLQKIIFDGDIEVLKLTSNAQVAIMLTSIAALKVLEESKQKHLYEFINMVAGHSLGEYSALVASGALSFTDAVKLLTIRGKAMENAVPDGRGGMLAVIGVNDLQIINDIATKASEQSNEICVVANNNSPGQVILSGSKNALNLAESIAKEEFKVKIIKHLEVSGPFHSPYMEPAKLELAKELNSITFSDFKIPVVSNVTGTTFNDKNDINNLLLEQVVSPVKWAESMQYAVKSGADCLFEVGPSKVLTGLMKRIDQSVTCVNIEKEEDILQVQL
ncbi:ACP S-malonyltransferase [Rickettsiales bacterium LUAb2]